MPSVPLRVLRYSRRAAGRVKFALTQPVREYQVRARLAKHLPLSTLPKHIAGYTLFFAPEAGVNAHLTPQCLLARTLHDLGHSTLFVRCYKVFSRCPVMDMYGLPYESEPKVRAQTCLRCAADSIRILDEYGLNCIDLRDFDSPEIRERVRLAVMAAPADLREMVFDSISFGLLAAMDLALAKKVSEFGNVSGLNRIAWLKYIESSILSYLLMEAISRKLPISRVVYFNDYSLMLGARMAVEKRQIPVISVTLASHRNLDRRRFVIRSEVGSLTFRKNLAFWPQWRELALSEARVTDIAEDILLRLKAKGSHSYSPAKTFDGDIHSQLGLSKSKKLIVAYTSSLDEMLATQMTHDGLRLEIPAARQPFLDQVEWLRSLADFLAPRDDLQLVVRVHPREGVNRRENIASQHLSRLKVAFTQSPHNCHIIWPEDPVSSYDLGELADLVLVSWSTIGLEMSRLGVPVLACASGVSPLPHDDFMEWGSTPEEYFQVLDALLARPLTLRIIAHAFRWYNLNHLGASLDMGDVVLTAHYDGLPEYRLPSQAKAIEQIIVDGKNALEVNYDRLLTAQHANAAAEEDSALRRQLRRIVRFLLTGEESAEDYRLVFADKGRAACSRDAGAISIEREGSLVRLALGDRVWEKLSPMCARLAALCAHGVVGP